MKKVLFVKKDKGCATPEAKAEALKKYCRLINIVNDPITGNTLKYYSLEGYDILDKVAEVTIINNRIVSVRNVPVMPQFGGF